MDQRIRLGRAEFEGSSRREGLIRCLETACESVRDGVPDQEAALPVMLWWRLMSTFIFSLPSPRAYRSRCSARIGAGRAPWVAPTVGEAVRLVGAQVLTWIVRITTFFVL